jgi:hypothetical protein
MKEEKYFLSRGIRNGVRLAVMHLPLFLIVIFIYHIMQRVRISR